jgi:pentatricopeptide repeat protein
MQSKIIRHINLFKYDKAIATYQQAIQQTVPLSDKTYIILLEKLKHERQVTHSILNQLSPQRIQKNNRLSRAVLRAYAELGDVQHTQQWYHHCCKQSQQQQQQQHKLFNALLQAYVKNRMFDEGFQLVLQSESEQPDVHSFTMLLSACHNMSQIQLVLSEMKKYPHVKPNINWYTNLIQSLCILGHGDNALLIYQDLKQKNQVNAHMLYSLFRAYEDNETMTQSLLQDMKQLNINPPEHLACYLLSISADYRNSVYTSLLTQNVQNIQSIHEKNPLLYSTLKQTMKQNGDARFSKVSKYLKEMNIIIMDHNQK